jgi:hypothetical protein
VKIMMHLYGGFALMCFELAQELRPFSPMGQGGDSMMWKENAVAVEQRDGEATIICEGVLSGVISALRDVSARRLAGIKVSLPDRGAAPFRFEGNLLQALLNDPGRPQSTPLPLLAAFTGVVGRPDGEPLAGPREVKKRGRKSDP